MIEFYQSPEESVIITEYLEGSDLFASLSESEFELTEAKCRVIVSQVQMNIFINQIVSL